MTNSSYQDLALLSDELNTLSMCFVNARFIYLTVRLCDGKIVDSCHRYDIERNLWQEMDKFNQPRYGYSSCQIGGNIYMFYEYNKNLDYLNSVEKVYITVNPDQ